MFKKILFVLFLTTFAFVNAQTRYATYGKNSHGKYKYTSVSNDPSKTRWYVLENGLTVILSQNKDVPRIQTLIATKAGSKNDPSDNTGLAHYLEHMLFKGTDSIGTIDFKKEKEYLDKIDLLYEQYNKTKEDVKRKKIYKDIDSISGLAAKYSIANEYDKICQHLGAQGTNAFTSVEQTVYINNIPNTSLNAWLKLEAERFRKPILRLFHTELEAVYEEKNISMDSDMDEAYEKLYASLFRNHTYGTQTTIGTIEHLKNPSLNKIREYYETYYVPNNMAIILSGDLDYEKTIEMVEKAFGYMKAKPMPEFKFKVEYPRAWKDSISVVGPDAAQVMLAWRFEGANHNDVIKMQLVDLILSNSKAGLIDLNLVKEQKVLSAGCSPDVMKDYSIHLFYGKPKEGQTLEEVEKLLLEQIEKIKNGNFDEELLKSIILNNEIDKIKEMESYQSVGYSLMNSFVMETPWIKTLNLNYEMSRITKQQIIDFVKENYNGGYTIVYKRVGEKSNKLKIDKPEINEVELNKDKVSVKAKNLYDIQLEKTIPVWVDFQKDFTKTKAGKHDLLYKKNDKNKLFTLYYVVDLGKNHNKKLPFALEYLQYVGIKNKSAAELSIEFYKLGCEFGISAGDRRSYVYLEGPQENFEKALQLFEELMENAIPDQKSLDDFIQRKLKARDDSKLNKRAVSRALYSYALYGKNNPFTNTLNNAELKALKATELTEIIKKITDYKHTVMYYGPANENDLSKVLVQYHKTSEVLLVAPAPIEFKPIKITERKVYFTHYNMVQAEINWTSGTQNFDKNTLAKSALFNEYFGGGMGSIVFQEIRESRALAYSTYAYYNTASYKVGMDVFNAYIGTQADKMTDAIAAMQTLITQFPKDEEAFNKAKQAVLSSYESERVNKTSVFFNYLDASDFGFESDKREFVYNTVKSLTLADIENFYNEHIKNQNWHLCITASNEKVKPEDLSIYGKVTVLSLDEIFGY